MADQNRRITDPLPSSADDLDEIEGYWLALEADRPASTPVAVPVPTVLPASSSGISINAGVGQVDLPPLAGTSVGVEAALPSSAPVNPDATELDGPGVALAPSASGEDPENLPVATANGNDPAAETTGAPSSVVDLDQEKLRLRKRRAALIRFTTRLAMDLERRRRAANAKPSISAPPGPQMSAAASPTAAKPSPGKTRSGFVSLAKRFVGFLAQSHSQPPASEAAPTPEPAPAKPDLRGMEQMGPGEPKPVAKELNN